MTPEQCRGARAMLDMSQDELAQRAKVTARLLSEFESGKRTLAERSLDDIRTVLGAGGVEFIPENGGGVGVRLKKTRNAGTIPLDNLNAENDE